MENKRKSGDFTLGISKVLVQGFRFSRSFPQSSPHLFKAGKRENLSLKWEVICNYKKVILATHKFTAVITTNFKYKTFSWRVPLMGISTIKTNQQHRTHRHLELRSITQPIPAVAQRPDNHQHQRHHSACYRNLNSSIQQRMQRYDTTNYQYS